MRFWDASAVVPLLVRQVSSPAMQGLYRSDPTLAVWCFTPVEGWSAVCRLRREGLLDSPRMRVGRAHLLDLAARWVEIDDLRSVRDRAVRLLETHALRAGDALQLAAALVFVSDRPDRMGFVTLDDRLAEAAEREGFEVLGTSPGGS